jgi:TonB family protein
MELPINAKDTGYVFLLETITVTPNNIANSISNNLNVYQPITIIYLTGVAIFSVLFLIQIIQLGLLVKKFGISKKFGVNLVVANSQLSPFSFFNMVFIGNNIIDKKQLEKILIHEQIHIRQKHSVDIILFELFAIVQWFNPFIWFYKSTIKNVHEYLADQGVLSKGHDRKDYQNLLLHQTFGFQFNSISNNFNKSLLKTRIKMMTKTKTKKMALLKLLFVVPAAIALALFFSISITNNLVAQVDKSAKEVIQNQEEQKKVKQNPDLVKSKEIKDAYIVPDEMPQFPGGTQAQLEFIKSNIKYPESARKNGIEGRVFITFIVEKDGRITGVEKLRGFNEECDAEAIRVIKMMPDWIPGKVDGQPVRTVFNIPIVFKLDNKEKKSSR